MEPERNGRRFLFVFFAAAAIVLASCAHEEMAAGPVKADVVAKTGGKVLLFHGGTVEAKKVFCPGEVITAYRYSTPYAAMKPVGKVQLGKYVGGHYIDAKVIEGDVKTGDVVEKGSAACLVVPGMR